MSQHEFDKLLENVEKMAAVVEKLPEELRELVYNSLVAALLDDARVKVDSSSIAFENGELNTTSNASNIDRNIAKELQNSYSRYSLSSVNDMEFAAWVAYFYAKLAPPADMAEKIDETHYKKVCVITGRKLPSRITGTMNNAKNHKAFLESHGNGVYSISAMGEHYVRHSLLKENE